MTNTGNLTKRMVAGIAVSVALVACGSDESPSADTDSVATPPLDTDTGEPAATEPSDAAAAQASSAAACDPAEVSIRAMTFDIYEEEMEAAKQAVEAANPGLEVELSLLPGGDYLELAQTVVADTAVGNRPDLILSGLGNTTFVVDGLDPRPIDRELLSDTYDDKFLSAGTVDGELYVVPWQASVPLWFYNKDMFEAAGLDPESPPSTIDEFLRTVEALADEFGDGVVHMRATGGGDWFFQNAIQAGGGRLINDDGTPAFDTDEAKRGLSLWSTPAQEGWHLDVPHADARPLFAQQELAIITSSSANLGGVTPEVGEAFDWGVFIHPSDDGLDPSWAIGGSGFAVLSEDDCNARFSTEMINALVQPDLIAETAAATGYVPVNTAAYELLDDFYSENPAWSFALEFDDGLVGSGGWRGERALEVNLYLEEQLLRITKGEDVDRVISETAEQIQTILGS